MFVTQVHRGQKCPCSKTVINCQVCSQFKEDLWRIIVEVKSIEIVKQFF